ncbi:MAG: YihY/virulence factor BrkB family protein [Bryobacteraceae bacterium]|nr:YihY/virulence factor BrkB family protein [Bryobacteraceae bacterium]MDW8380469.1 YihY/virulence factor BrkB family protein [Bryobacterales bacterium]
MNPHPSPETAFSLHKPRVTWWMRLKSLFGPTLRYWMEVEVHVYGFSIAANVLLSFFPFLIVMVSLCRYVLHWNAAEQAIYLALSDLFPDAMGEYVVRNLKAAFWTRGPFQFASVFLLFFTANGVFEPLEVALNRALGVAKHRSFLMNQVVSLGLIFACGALVMLSFLLTAANQQFLARLLGVRSALTGFLTSAFFKIAALPISIVVLFVIYWLLPNTKIRPGRVVPVAILAGLTLEALKYLIFLVWPWLNHKLTHEYGPFKYSAMIILFSFLASMIVLAGAEWLGRDRIAPTSKSSIDSNHE